MLIFTVYWKGRKIKAYWYTEQFQEEHTKEEITKQASVQEQIRAEIQDYNSFWNTF